MDKIPWTLIIAKLSNTLTEADNRLLEEWLQNDLHKEIYLSVAHVWHSVQSKVRDYEPDEDYYWTFISNRINKVEKKKFELSKSRLFGIIGTLVGFAFMICAPGNYVRNAEFKDDTFIIIKIVRRTLDITNNLENLILPLLIAIIILISLKIYHKKKIEKESYAFILGGFAATYAMVLSPTFPERAWTGTIIFFVIAITILAFDLDKINRLYKFVLVDLCIILSVIYIGQYINLARDINDLRHTWNYRAKVINNSNKNKMFKFYKYVTIDSKNPAYGLNDIDYDSKVWPNNSISKYYGIKGIKAKQ